MNELYKPFQPTLTAAGLECFSLSLQYSSACSHLRGVVHSYLQVSAAKPTPYPVMPDGTQAVFISPHGSKIGGARSAAHDIQILQPGDYFGIRFHPGALRYFFDLDLSEITDQFVDHRYFPCPLFGELHDNIYCRQNFQERAHVCEQWLLRHFTPRIADPFDHALSLVYQSFGSLKVSQLAATVGWSTRHLNRRFLLHTGLNTKTFAQIIRIQHVCKQLITTANDSLQTALELGYFDQSHLIKDFKKRLLTNPSLFFERFMSDFYNR